MRIWTRISGDPAAFVLADEAPHNQLTPITADHPAIPSHSTSSTSPRTSAPNTSREEPISSPGPTQLGTNPSRTSLPPPVNPRRRRRSPSSETAEAVATEESSGQRGGRRNEHSREAGPSDRWLPLEKPSSPKRRRLDKKTMRLDSESSKSNGARHQSNGSSVSPVQKSSYPNSSSTNGHSSKNGASSPHQNGTTPTLSRAKTNSYFGHDREEVTRLIIQGLGDLGYYNSAERLSIESGYEVEAPSVAAFRHAVLQGEWAEAEALLFGTDVADDGGGVSISNGNSHHHEGLRFAENANKKELRFRMREQKYLELLEERDLGSALMVLRQELTPMNQDTLKLHELSR